MKLWENGKRKCVCIIIDIIPSCDFFLVWVFFAYALIIMKDIEKNKNSKIKKKNIYLAQIYCIL